MDLWFVLSLLISIVVVVFAVMNANPVPVNIFFLQYELSLALVIFISAALGALIALILSSIKQFKLKKEVKQMTKENEALLLENQILKSTASPMVDDESEQGSIAEKSKDESIHTMDSEDIKKDPEAEKGM